MEERGTQREGQRGAMDQWEYRTFRFSMQAAEDPASYDRFGAEGWELAGITAITSTLPDPPERHGVGPRRVQAAHRSPLLIERTDMSGTTARFIPFARAPPSVRPGRGDQPFLHETPAERVEVEVAFDAAKPVA